MSDFKTLEHTNGKYGLYSANFRFAKKNQWSPSGDFIQMEDEK